MHTYFKHFYVIFKQKLYLGPQNDILLHLPTVLTQFKMSFFFIDKWLLTKCEVRFRDYIVRATNFLRNIWNSSENWRKVYSKKSLHSPGSSVFLINIHEKCYQRAHEVRECKLKRLDDWSLCEVLPDVLNWKPPSSNFKLPCLPAFQSVAR